MTPERRLDRCLTHFLGIALLALLLASCKGSPSSADKSAPTAPPEIVVGSLLALTGQDQSFGITQQQGMDIALDEVNASGGVGGKPLRIIYADTRLDEELGLQEYNRLTRDAKISVIVGITGSGVALRLAPRANQDQVVLLDSIDTSPRLTAEGGDYFFRNIASDSYAGRVISTWALDREHRRAALVFNSEVPWATGCRSSIEEAFKAQGGQLVADPIAVVESTTDFSAAINAIRRAAQPADAVFVCLMGRQAGLFVAQATANELAGPFYGTDPLSQQEFVDNAGHATDRAFLVLPAEGQNDRYKAFAAKYRQRHGKEPDTIAAKAYDAVYLLAEAVRAATRDGRQMTGPLVRDALVHISIEGATGPNAFDKNGDLREALFGRFTYRGGQRVPVP